ncbi:MAG: Response regulator ArlR [Synergistetes bacterium ADurb.Bin155]|jgi:two-component system copper resistance phosphate regulon response regulator CusR|nr:response regulator transcription factor [Synergistales bacterium]MBP8995889.1 response regulator transcription factor [Synergistales bacterium]NMD18190.1 response regulator transcription factor [Synergistaceae bacterium]OQB46335.1 MAG: Response regulator ArlR [Synergistetes bacterium ADurb.Bin155]HOC82344.1 response regulator transcription factor [Synergistales bacterium]
MNILIVEDNRDLVQVLTEGFNELEFSVDSAYDGIEGLNKIRNNDYDCVVLDIMLPEMDGYELIGRMREEGKDTPVIMLTAKDSIEDRVEGLNRGADDYLVKPFDFRELVARVNAVTRRRTEPKRTVLHCGPLMLDPIARECKAEGEMVPLRRREFDILELLMRFENQVFSREKIIGLVWKKEYDGTSNVVDVHVKYLRDKLRPYNLDTVVVTVRGVGYKVTCPDYE